jgi:hypothetical protein
MPSLPRRPWARSGVGGPQSVRLQRQKLQEKIRNTASPFAPVSVVPGTSSLVLSGFAPTVSTPVVVTPAHSSLALTGSAPTVSTPQLLAPAKATILLSGFAPTLTVSPASTKPIRVGGAASPIRKRPSEFAEYWPALPAQLPISKRRRPVLAQPDVAQLAVDNSAAFAALYANGALSQAEFAALLAA